MQESITFTTTQKIVRFLVIGFILTIPYIEVVIRFWINKTKLSMSPAAAAATHFNCDSRGQPKRQAISYTEEKCLN